MTTLRRCHIECLVHSLRDDNDPDALHNFWNYLLEDALPTDSDDDVTYRSPGGRMNLGPREISRIRETLCGDASAREPANIAETPLEVDSSSRHGWWLAGAAALSVSALVMLTVRRLRS